MTAEKKKNENANDAININVFRRKGQFYVNAMVISAQGWRSLEAVLVVRPGANGLLEALEAAERQAHDLTKKKPRDQRLPKNPKAPDWSVAGVATWEEFLKGTTSVDIRRGNDETEMTFFVPKGRDMLLPTTLTESLAPWTPLTKVAPVVADMFARADKTKPKLA